MLSGAAMKKGQCMDIHRIQHYGNPRHMHLSITQKANAQEARNSQEEVRFTQGLTHREDGGG